MKSEGEKRLGEPRGSQMAPDGFREVPPHPRRPPTRTSQHLHTLRQYIYIVYLSPRCMPYCIEVSTTLSLSLSLCGGRDAHQLYIHSTSEQRWFPRDRSFHKRGHGTTVFFNHAEPGTCFLCWRFRFVSIDDLYLFLSPSISISLPLICISESVQ